jgi:coenzyme F420-reducing hydrogenase alpha subunit
LVGPLARVNNCFGHLPSEIHLLLRQLGIQFPSKNMYQSIIARAIEIYYCVLESIRILESYYYPESAHVKLTPRQGHGFGCTEAPRGMLWHYYEIDESGKIRSARIVPPTSQNQARIEEDLKISLTHFGLEKSVDELRSYSEMIIRNYDPCISCSTHFINLKVKHL